jgi:short-subunit dehydrogenase
MALCPGPTRTEFGDVAGVTGEFERIGPLFMTADRVVRAALRSFDHGDVICVPGAVNLAGATGVRLLPRFAVRRLLEPVFRRR